MEVKFIVPDGETCDDCPQQTYFQIDEKDVVYHGSRPRTIREITATCNLFCEEIRGTALTQMIKCPGCRKSAKVKHDEDEKQE